MSPETYFALTLIVKMAITAGFVLTATMVAERAGPLVGGLVATLPLGAGPVYVFLALDHDAQFIAESATNSLAINMVNVVFALTYAVLAQRRSLAVSLSAALAVWVVLAFAVHLIPWTFGVVVLANIVVMAVCIAIARPLRHVPIPRMSARWYELAVRALLVAMLVGVVVTLSFRIGPAGSGILAPFPIILMSVMYILHRRVGGRPAAAVLANAVIGLVGFALACAVLHLAAEPFGSFAALTLALMTSIGWSLLVYGLRRRGITL
jgi:hypothetical protein